MKKLEVCEFFLPFFSVVVLVRCSFWDMTLLHAPEVYYIGRVFALRQFRLLCLPPAVLFGCKTSCSLLYGNNATAVFQNRVLRALEAGCDGRVEKIT